MDQTGNKVGQYTITKQIGRGAFADVFEVTNNKKEKLALKMIAKNRSVISRVTFRFILKNSSFRIKKQEFKVRNVFQIYLESSNVSKKILAEIRVLEEIDHKFILKFVEGFKGWSFSCCCHEKKFNILKFCLCFRFRKRLVFHISTKQVVKEKIHSNLSQRASC